MYKLSAVEEGDLELINNSLDSPIEVDETPWHEANNIWKQRIPWYPDGCFGLYRMASEGYTRRELLADAAIHTLGVVGGLLGVGALLERVAIHKPPVEVALSIALYSVSLLAMMLCSAIFNGLAWSSRIWELQLADHAGILLLIAGTYSPLMIVAGCPRVLTFVWLLASISFGAKALRSKADVIALHVPCFLAMGWAVVIVWQDVCENFTPWAQQRALLGGVLYTLGLIPWAANTWEFHNALWHAFVLAASACFFSVQFFEVSEHTSFLQ